jgi:SAM-dependent methyltransferase
MGGTSLIVDDRRPRAARVPPWRRAARTIVAAPGLRWLMPGWPDAGRRIVQTPALATLIQSAVARNGRPDRALNAGAGEGLYSPLIRRHSGAKALFEFDLAVPPLAIARRAGGRRFSASLTHIPLATASISLAVCTEVLEHVPDDELAVRELSRVLQPGGALVLSVPTPPAVFDPAHVREGYTADQLRTLFGRHGLEIVDARYCMHGVFQAVLKYWRPRRVPLAIILAAAWIDRLIRPGQPMDLAVLALRRGDPS